LGVSRAEIDEIISVQKDISEMPGGLTMNPPNMAIQK